MAVSAVEQLQVMASKRQYKEAAAQLEVSTLSLQYCFLTAANLLHCYLPPAVDWCFMWVLGERGRKQIYCDSEGVMA